MQGICMTELQMTGKWTRVIGIQELAEAAKSSVKQAGPRSIKHRFEERRSMARIVNRVWQSPDMWRPHGR